MPLLCISCISCWGLLQRVYVLDQYEPLYLCGSFIEDVEGSGYAVWQPGTALLPIDDLMLHVILTGLAALQYF